MNMDTEIFDKSGTSRSKTLPDFNLLPREMIEALTRRLELGLRQKGDREVLSLYRRSTPEGKRRILEDDLFFATMTRNAFNHLIDLKDGNFSEDDLTGHVGAIMWNVGMLEWRRVQLTKLEEQSKSPEK